MMEHVGIGHFDEYFLKIRELLTPDGYAFVHCIGRMSQPGTTGPFIRKYIFPGAYVPALSETFAATERCGLWCDDMEVLRLHYRYTVKHWRERFAENRVKAVAVTNERFCRMWEFYLAAVELEFLHGSHMVFQLLLSTKRECGADHARFYGRFRAGGLGKHRRLNDVDSRYGRVCPTATLRNTRKPDGRPVVHDGKRFFCVPAPRPPFAQTASTPSRRPALHIYLRNTSRRYALQSHRSDRKSATPTKASLLTSHCMRTMPSDQKRKIRNVRFNENIRLYLPILWIDL